MRFRGHETVSIDNRVRVNVASSNRDRPNRRRRQRSSVQCSSSDRKKTF